MTDGWKDCSENFLQTRSRPPAQCSWRACSSEEVGSKLQAGRVSVAQELSGNPGPLCLPSPNTELIPRPGIASMMTTVSP